MENTNLVNALLKSNAPSKFVENVLRLNLTKIKDFESKEDHLKTDKSIENKKCFFITEGIECLNDKHGHNHSRKGTKLLPKGPLPDKYSQKGMHNEKTFTSLVNISEQLLDFDYERAASKDYRGGKNNISMDIDYDKPQKKKRKSRNDRMNSLKELMLLHEQSPHLLRKSILQEKRNVWERLHKQKLQSSECIGYHVIDPENLQLQRKIRSMKKDRKSNDNIIGRFAGQYAKSELEKYVKKQKQIQTMTKKRNVNASRIQKAILDYNMKEQSKLILEQKRLEAFRMRLSLCHDLSQSQRISYYGNPVQTLS